MQVKARKSIKSVGIGKAEETSQPEAGKSSEEGEPEEARKSFEPGKTEKAGKSSG